jgi:outer membrane protein assembly factor BamB
VNKRRIAAAGGLALLGALLLMASPAGAVIERPYPLQKAIDDAQMIFMVKVDRLAPDKPAVVLAPGDALKGKVPFAKLPVNLTGDDDAQKKKETPQLLKRLAPKLPLAVFVTKQDKQYLGLAYTNGTWFQLTAPADGDNPVWSFTHFEPYLRRTFKGTTAEMQETLADAIAGKKPAPKVDPKEKPGIGPEVEEKADKPAALGVSDGPLFAVIPTVAIGGLVSLLAMMFPAVFGGLTGQLKRWAAVISVISFNTTLLWVQDWFAKDLGDSWWGSTAALWVTMTSITAVGVLWAWRRQVGELSRFIVSRDESRETMNQVPTRYEAVLLIILSAIGVAMFAVCLLLRYPILSLPWSFVLVLWVGIWAATLYVLLVRWRSARPRTQPALSSEGVVLWAMLPACLALGCSSSGVGGGGGGGGGVLAGDGGRGAQFVEATVVFTPAGAAGGFDATTLIDGDRLYTAGEHSGAFNTTFGAVYCVERFTGRPLWTFNDGGKMKKVFSSPCLAAGKLYVGEGFHDDSQCKLYCLDAATGQKLWAYPTRSHTESSPCVAGGKVYCGAGGDGLLCLDAATGDKVWQYEKGHIDCPPVVVGGRVYCGSGVDRDLDGPQETAVFCLDAETGQEIWREKTDLPAWGKPVVSGEQAFFPLGNGDAAKSVEPPARPAGAILCLAAKDGKPVWRFDAPDGVIEGPAADGAGVYFGCRDGHCYCVGRGDGKLRWRHDLGSPVVASPALAACSCCGLSNSVYAVSAGDPEKGIAPKLCCLDPASGAVMWQYDHFTAATIISKPVVTVEPGRDGDRRSVYFGASTDSSTRAVLYCLKDQWKDEQPLAASQP